MRVNPPPTYYDQLSGSVSSTPTEPRGAAGGVRQLQSERVSTTAARETSEKQPTVAPLSITINDEDDDDYDAMIAANFQVHYPDHSPTRNSAGKEEKEEPNPGARSRSRTSSGEELIAEHKRRMRELRSQHSTKMHELLLESDRRKKNSEDEEKPYYGLLSE